MAVEHNYTITDPLLDTSYPLIAMENAGKYGYKADDREYIDPSVRSLSIPLKKDTLELSTEYSPWYNLLPNPCMEQMTTYQHICIFYDTSVFYNLVENIHVSIQTLNDFALKNHNEQFIELVRFLGFNKTEWADIFSVSRPTIYGWLKNEIKPSGDNASKISRLYSLVNTIPNRQEGDQLFRGYLHHHLSSNNCSLYDVFRSNIIEDGQGAELGEILSALLEKSQQKLKELEALKKTDLASKSTFDHNMRRLFS